MAEKSGYSPIDLLSVSYTVKLFNALYGTEHTTCAGMWEDLREVLNERVGTAQTGVVTVAFNVAQLVMGAVYVNACPLQPMIPISLIVAGALKLLRDLLTTAKWRTDVAIMRDDKLTPAQQLTQSRAFTWMLWAFWLLIYIWLVLSCVWLFSAISDLAHTAVKESAKDNILRHGGFRFPEGIRVDKVITDDDGQMHHVQAVDPRRSCSNTILMFAFFTICLRLTSVSLQLFIAGFIGVCGVLAICGAEADGLVEGLVEVPVDVVEFSDVPASLDVEAGEQ